MKAVVQRVHAARVEVDGEVVGEIAKGLVAFVGAQTGDDEADATFIAQKIVGLRVFADERGKMSLALTDLGGALLVVSQFTLLADTSRGNRPGFSQAMEPAGAKALVERVVQIASEKVTVAQGRFGADMRVIVDNDGPVTILFDSATRRPAPSPSGAPSGGHDTSGG